MAYLLFYRCPWCGKVAVTQGATLRPIPAAILEEYQELLEEDIVNEDLDEDTIWGCPYCNTWYEPGDFELVKEV